jgi:hypothetical protein
VSLGSDTHGPLLLAGDGGRYAAVTHRVHDAVLAPSASRCKLAIVDALTGTAERAHGVCGAQEVASGLALESGSAGPVAYVGIRRWAPGDSGWVGAGGRVESLDAVSGAVRAVYATPGVATHLTVAPAPGRIGTRLYVVETLSHAEADPPEPFRGRLLGLHPATLDVESEYWLRTHPIAIAIAPDGAHAFALDDTMLDLIHIDLLTGAERRRALPGYGLVLAVNDASVYVSGPFAGQVWALDHRLNGPARAIAVGRRPTGLAVGSR